MERNNPAQDRYPALIAINIQNTNQAFCLSLRKKPHLIFADFHSKKRLGFCGSNQNLSHACQSSCCPIHISNKSLKFQHLFFMSQIQKSSCKKKQNMFKVAQKKPQVKHHPKSTICSSIFQLQRTHPSPTKLHFLLEVLLLLLLLLEICSSTEWYLLLRRQADT